MKEPFSPSDAGGHGNNPENPPSAKSAAITAILAALSTDIDATPSPPTITSFPDRTVEASSATIEQRSPTVHVTWETDSEGKSRPSAHVPIDYSMDPAAQILSDRMSTALQSMIEESKKYLEKHGRTPSEEYGLYTYRARRVLDISVSKIKHAQEQLSTIISHAEETGDFSKVSEAMKDVVYTIVDVWAVDKKLKGDENPFIQRERLRDEIAAMQAATRQLEDALREIITYKETCAYLINIITSVARKEGVSVEEYIEAFRQRMKETCQ